jgi:hypothetical protein
MWVLVRGALLARTTLSKCVESTCCFKAEDWEKGQRCWEEWRRAGDQLKSFHGPKEELEVIMNYVQGKLMFLRKGAQLTVYSDQRASCVGRQRGLVELVDNAA